MLKLLNLNKYYRDSNGFHALKDICLQFEKGEFVAILGESGSGKSTLLNVICGLDTYESGVIEINGQSTEHFHRKEWAIYRNRFVGFIFQEYNLVDHLSIVENVELPLLLQGVSTKDARIRAIEKCTLLGLKNHLYKVPAKVSGGQQQRAAIARSLVTEPKVILADEPTGALDSENAKIILDILKKLSKDHIVILVTHDEEFAEKYADRVIVLEDGSVKSDSRPINSTNTDDWDGHHKKPSMKWKVLSTFAKNNMSKRKFRTLFTALTMSIGLIAIFLILFLVNGIRTGVTDFITEIIPKDQYTIRNEKRNAFVDDESLENVQSLNHVESAYFKYTAYPLTNDIVYTIDHPNFPDGLDVYDREDYVLNGIPEKVDQFIYKNELVGKYPSNKREILITSTLAEDLSGIKDIKQSELNRLLTYLKDDDFIIKRLSHINELNASFKVVGIIYSSQSEAYVYNAALDDFYNLLSADDHAIEDEYYTTLPISRDNHNIVVYLDTDREKEIESLEDELLPLGLVLKSPGNEVYHSINDFFDTVLFILVGTASFSLIVSGLLVGLMVYISVIERVKEIGILTSLGAKSSNIRSLFIFESAAIGFLSSLIALGISLLITYFINYLFDLTIGRVINSLNIFNQQKIKILDVDWLVIIIVLLISIVFAVLCGLIPAIKASRLKAVEALRQE